MLSATSALAFIPFGMVAAIGPAALALLLGPGWESASAMVPLMALNAALYFLCSIGYAIDEVRCELRGLLIVQVSVTVSVLCSVGAAASMRSLTVIPAAMAVGPAVGHALQLSRWHRAGLVDLSAMLRVHLVHAAIGGSLFVAGHAGAQYGHSPLGATAWGLSAMLPVVAFWLAMRRSVPIFGTAAAHGLIPWPARTGRL
jgi:hypothetical protein